MSENIVKLNINKKYKPKILGLGEVYEQASVEYKRIKLLKKLKCGILFLSSNSSHSGKGLSLSELEKKVTNKGFKILKSGFVDSPFWKSKKITNPRKFITNKLIINLAKIVFVFVVRLENMWEGSRNSHMVYVIGKKLQKTITKLQINSKSEAPNL